MTTTILFDDEQNVDIGSTTGISEIASQGDEELKKYEYKEPKDDSKDIKDVIKEAENNPNKPDETTTVNNSEPIDISDIQNFGISTFIEDYITKSVSSVSRGFDAFLLVDLISKFNEICVQLKALWDSASKQISADIINKYAKQGSLLKNTIPDYLNALMTCCSNTINKLQASKAYENYNTAKGQLGNKMAFRRDVFVKDIADMFKNIIAKENDERETLKKEMQNQGLDTRNLKKVGGDDNKKDSKGGGSSSDKKKQHEWVGYLKKICNKTSLDSSKKNKFSTSLGKVFPKTENNKQYTIGQVVDKMKKSTNYTSLDSDIKDAIETEVMNDYPDVNFSLNNRIFNKAMNSLNFASESAVNPELKIVKDSEFGIVGQDKRGSLHDLNSGKVLWKSSDGAESEDDIFDSKEADFLDDDDSFDEDLDSFGEDKESSDSGESDSSMEDDFGDEEDGGDSDSSDEDSESEDDFDSDDSESEDSEESSDDDFDFSEKSDDDDFDFDDDDKDLDFDSDSDDDDDEDSDSDSDFDDDEGSDEFEDDEEMDSESTDDDTSDSSALEKSQEALADAMQTIKKLVEKI